MRETQPLIYDLKDTHDNVGHVRVQTHDFQVVDIRN